MANISGWDSSSLSTLFSSLNSSGSKRNSATSLGIDLKEYASIKSGAYYKLMKSYYGGNENASKIVSNTSTSSDSAKTLASIQDTAKDLVDTAKDLYKTGSKSVFKKDSEGNYNTDEIYSKVKDFVDDYNSLVKSASKTETNSIANAAAAMINSVSNNDKNLANIGISIDKENHTLKIDEDKFKKADMSAVKSMFSGTGSFAYSVASNASMVKHYADTEASKSNTYSASGNYTYNYNTGTIYNSET